MEAVYTSVILAFLCTSVVCAVGLQTPKTTGGKSKTKATKSFFPETNCGISETAINGGRIVGGKEARPHSWPWQVLIECTFVRGGVLNGTSCGGSIISNHWVITSAHCIYPYLPDIDIQSSCKVLLGKHDLQRNESTQLIAKIDDYYIHEKYHPVKLDNGYDLALFRLEKPLLFTDAIKPICLPFGLPQLPYGKTCYVTGWGFTTPGSKKLSDRLMQLSTTVTDEKYYCSFVVFDERLICTGDSTVKNDFCHGDYGGPLACQEDDRKWYLRGVLSMREAISGWTHDCDLWTVFTNVTFFEKWIKTITSRTKCGISATAPNGGLIVGDEEAKPHSWPWQVFIECTFVRDGVLNSTSCGGSLISNKYIITSAHCLYLPNIDIQSSCKVLLGKHDLQRNESTQLIAKILYYYIHMKYDPVKLENGYDLALCRLASFVRFTDAIQAICLPFGLHELYYETTCYATGWGLTKPDSQRLMQASIKVTDEEFCDLSGSDLFCASAPWNGGKVCHGDSGGPMVCQEQDRKWYLRGVLSGGPKDCDLWAAFTHVTSFENWIKIITSRN